jgi:hypothetical protein
MFPMTSKHATVKLIQARITEVVFYSKDILTPIKPSEKLSGTPLTSWLLGFEMASTIENDDVEGREALMAITRKLLT